MWFSSVVLPLPKKPVIMVTGMPCLTLSMPELGWEVTAEVIGSSPEISNNFHHSRRCEIRVWILRMSLEAGIFLQGMPEKKL
jgi:hypothetical protein